MLIFWWVVAFVFGLVIGSFLNVVIYRLPRDESLLKPPSHCPRCNAIIAWFDNIPVLSFLLLGGRCRNCKEEISVRYPMVELLTGILFAIIYFRFFVEGSSDIPVFIVSVAFVSALVAASFIDIEHQIIPDEITLPGMAIAPLVSLFLPSIHQGLLFSERHLGSLADGLAGMALGAGLIYLAGFLGKLAFKREAMGFGDVKLMAMIGGFLGWKETILAFFLAPIFGTIVGLFILLRTRNRVIPYGPFLSLAAVLSMIWGRDIIDWYLGFLR